MTTIAWSAGHQPGWAQWWILAHWGGELTRVVMTTSSTKMLGRRPERLGPGLTQGKFIWPSLLCWKNFTFLDLESSIHPATSVTKPSVSIWWGHNCLCKDVARGLLHFPLLVNTALCNQKGKFCWLAKCTITRYVWQSLSVTSCINWVVGCIETLQTCEWMNYTTSNHLPKYSYIYS